MVRYILLDIYESARCEDFKTFIQTKKDTKLPSLVELMQESEDKYWDLIKSGKWSQTPKDELILALQAKTEQLTKENKGTCQIKMKEGQERTQGIDKDKEEENQSKTRLSKRR